MRDKTPPKEPPEHVPQAGGSEEGLSVGIDALKAYLRANPDALDGDRELVSLLTPPAFHHGPNVVDMQGFVIARLKAQASERAARDLKIRQALAADALEERRIQKAALMVSSARSFEALIAVITNDLAPILGASVVTLNFERPEGAGGSVEFGPVRPGGPIQLVPKDSIERFLGPGTDVKVGMPGMGDAPQFPRRGASVRSFIAARLTFAPSAPTGLIAIGSKTAGRFSKATGLHRYTFLARIIEHGVRLWLDLPSA